MKENMMEFDGRILAWDEDAVRKWVRGVLPAFHSERLEDAVVAHLLDGGLEEFGRRQLEYAYMYYAEGVKIPRIGTLCDVHKSTVSRMLQRADEKVMDIAEQCEWQLRRGQFFRDGEVNPRARVEDIISDASVRAKGHSGCGSRHVGKEDMEKY